jgi:hypothetical protein
VAVAQYGSSAGQGRCEIVCGGAGAGTYSRKAAPTDAWAMDKFTQSYNFIYCEVNGCTLKITAYGPTDNIIDQFTLDKSATCVNTAVNDVSEKFNPISVYPNPSTGTFSLKLSSQDIGNAEVTVFDMYGKQVFSKSVQKNSIDFDQKFELGKVAAGIYNVSIQVKNQKDNAILVVTSK